MVRIEGQLFLGADRRARAEHAPGHEGLEEAQLVHVDAHRVEGTDIERANLHVLHSPTGQSFGGSLARCSDPFGPDEAVVLVLDLEDVGVQLAPLSIYADPKCRVVGMWRSDGLGKVAYVFP